MSNNPIRVSNLASLTNLGVDPQYLRLNVTSFESDKCICINDKTPVIKYKFFKY